MRKRERSMGGGTIHRKLFPNSCFTTDGSYTISTLIPVESAWSFGDGRCCHPSGYLQIDGIRLPADGATSSRLRHQPQSSAPVCTRLLCLGLSRGPRPSACFAGYIVHPCTRCSQGSPVGFICRIQMTTTRPSQGLVSTGLVALGLPPNPSPKSLRQFHQTNRVIGIIFRLHPAGSSR
jgi:hypothetical protein